MVHGQLQLFLVLLDVIFQGGLPVLWLFRQAKNLHVRGFTNGGHASAQVKDIFWFFELQAFLKVRFFKTIVSFILVKI